MIQKFLVFVTVEADLSYEMSPEIVKDQIQRFLVGRRITDNLPYHGNSVIKATHALDVDKLFNEFPS